MLDVGNLSAAYGQHPALQDVSLHVNAGEIVVILGANGAGKSTLLRAISGVCEGHVDGAVTLDRSPLSGLSPDQIVEHGIALVPEGRGIFGDLTVKENLTLGAYSNRARSSEATNLDRVLQLFPKLRERQGQIARTMSGGEQQMVAIGRAMMSAPRILMLDEPSLGLSPLLCKELFQNLRTVKDLGIGILLVEQNAKQSLAIADRGYLLENTHITHEDSADRLATDSAVQKAYLGVGSKASAPAGVTPPTATSQTPAMKARAQPRRTANQQIGLDIEDMVQGASATSANAMPTAAPANVTQAQVDQITAPRLTAVLQEIELAAKNARDVPALQMTTLTATPRPSTPQKAPEGKPPVIEIYRRPRVQIYRRRDGDFERD
ncbi:MAG: ATP-binding cassette domain-containing protein [Amylibacter sp.]